MDRRVQRTRETLHQALIALMLEKGYESITIQDILDRANVGRSTFYAHYRGKEELLRAGLKSLGKELLKVQREALEAPQRRPFAFSLALFEHAGDHRDLYQAIVGKNSGAMVMNAMRAMLGEVVRNELKALEPVKRTAGIPLAAANAFIVGALMSVLTWWLEEKSAVPPAEADRIFRSLALSAVGREGAS